MALDNTCGGIYFIEMVENSAKPAFCALQAARKNGKFIKHSWQTNSVFVSILFLKTARHNVM
jgi:hypothetical protein